VKSDALNADRVSEYSKSWFDGGVGRRDKDVVQSTDESIYVTFNL